MTSARRSALALAALLLLAPALAGCISKRPTLAIDVKPATSGFDEFAAFEISVRRYYLQQEGSAPEFFTIDPVNIDLLASGGASRVASAPIDVDSYEKIGIELASVRGTTLSGETPRIVYFNNLLYGVRIFHAGNGETKTFTLALGVEANRETGDLVLVAVDSETTLS